MKSLNKFIASPRKANLGSCRKLLVHYYLSATKKGKPLSLTFTGPKKTRIRKLKHGGNTRLRCGELKRAECLLWTVLRHICFLFVCLFVYIYLFTPNLEKVCECNRRWLRKGPRSLVIGWDFLDQNHDGLTTGSARYEAVLSIGSNRTNTCKITLWSKDWKDTDTHTTTHKLTKSGFCNTKKRNRIILLRSKGRNFAQLRWPVWIMFLLIEHNFWPGLKNRYNLSQLKSLFLIVYLIIVIFNIQSSYSKS